MTGLQFSLGLNRALEINCEQSYTGKQWKNITLSNSLFSQRVSLKPFNVREKCQRTVVKAFHSPSRIINNIIEVISLPIVQRKPVKSLLKPTNAC